MSLKRWEDTWWNQQHTTSGTIERMAQGARKISDGTPVEKEAKLDKMRELEWRTRHSGWMDKQKERTWSSQYEMMSEESIITMPPEEMKECNEKNGEENNMFYLKWIWESILKKKDWTELLGNQQRKEQACWGLMENISRTWGENLP